MGLLLERSNLCVELVRPHAQDASALVVLLRDAGVVALTPIPHAELSILSLGFASLDDLEFAAAVLMGDPRVAAVCGTR